MQGVWPTEVPARVAPGLARFCRNGLARVKGVRYEGAMANRTDRLQAVIDRWSTERPVTMTLDSRDVLVARLLLVLDEVEAETRESVVRKVGELLTVGGGE